LVDAGAVEFEVADEVAVDEHARSGLVDGHERAAGLVLDADVDPEVIGSHTAGVVDGDL
jgi:hypothetical protein